MRFAKGMSVCVLACWILLESGALLSGAGVALAQSGDTLTARLSTDVESLFRQDEQLLEQVESLSEGIQANNALLSELDSAVSVPSFAWLILIVVIGLSAILALAIMVLGSWALWRSMKVRPIQSGDTTGETKGSTILDHPKPFIASEDEGLVLRGHDEKLIPGIRRCRHLLREIEAMLFYFTISSDGADKSAQEKRKDAFNTATNDLISAYDDVLSKIPASQQPADVNKESGDRSEVAGDEHLASEGRD